MMIQKTPIVWLMTLNGMFFTPQTPKDDNFNQIDAFPEVTKVDLWGYWAELGPSRRGGLF